MSDLPEELWVEPDGGDILIHNGDPDLDGLIATGFLTKYVRDDHSEALEAQVKAAVEALDRLVGLADDYSPFGGELLQDRVDRAWDSARAALAQIKGGE